jgi:hypothetical protein
MIAPLPEIVLVAVMVVHSPFGPAQLEYQSVDYYNSWSKCRQEQKRLSQKQDKSTAYICLKVDRN